MKSPLSLPLQAECRAGLGALRYSDEGGPLECGDAHFRPEGGLRERYGHFHEQVHPLPVEDIMVPNVDHDE